MEQLVMMWQTQLMAYRSTPNLENNLARALDAAIAKRFKQAEAKGVLPASGFLLWAQFEEGRSKLDAAKDILLRAHMRYPDFEHFPTHI
jgi:hypothetical protein